MDALYPHVVQVSNPLQAISNHPAEIRTAMSHELAQALSHGDGPFIWTLRGLTKGYSLVQAENADTLMSGVSSLYNSLKTVVKSAEESHISRMLQEQQIKHQLNATLARINDIPQEVQNKLNQATEIPYIRCIKGDVSYFNSEGILDINGEVQLLIFK